MNKLEEIRDELITEGFPELRTSQVDVEYVSLDDAILEYGELSGGGWFIEVNSILQTAPKRVVVGGLAHELSHISREKDMGGFQRFLDGMLYPRMRTYRVLDERNTDLEVILRGYGSQLLEFIDFCKKRGFPSYQNDSYTDGGLSRNEVARLIVPQRRERT